MERLAGLSIPRTGATRRPLLLCPGSPQATKGTGATRVGLAQSIGAVA